MTMLKGILAALAVATMGVIASATGAYATPVEAPLPLLGATPFAASALAAGTAFILRRRPGRKD